VTYSEEGDRALDVILGPGKGIPFEIEAYRAVMLFDPAEAILEAARENYTQGIKGERVTVGTLLDAAVYLARHGRRAEQRARGVEACRKLKIERKIVARSLDPEGNVIPLIRTDLTDGE
jgi:hypothetical protein